MTAFLHKTWQQIRQLAMGIIAVPAERPGNAGVALAGLAGIAAIWGAVWLDKLWLMALPFALLLLWWTVVDFHRIFFVMLACIPPSIEMDLPGGFGTDFPSEPLMWLLTLASVFWFIRNWRSIDGRFLRHPVTLALFIHLVWMAVSVAASEDAVVSFKFLLAKGWYVIVFYFLAGRVLDSTRAWKSLLWWFFIPLLITALIVLARHAPTGFSFKTVNFVMGPFYRNHVVYACLLAIFLPFVWYGAWWYRRWSWQWLLLTGGILVFLVGINFAYTRAAYVALVAAIGIRWLVRRRLMKATLVAVTLIFTLFVSWVSTRDNWLMFAPDYQKTVTHTRFDNLLEATTKLEDISTMERVYRWVAASAMIQDKPVLGFGPGNFYFFYKNYTVSSFKTYVSNNPERSGMHNYYLMTAVEQGIAGCFIFIGFCFFVMLRGEKVYHQTQDPARRRILLSAMLCFVLIDLLMLMNDFVETDKIGSLFFMSIAMLVNIDLGNRAQNEAQRA
ncbi:MAG: O-antigen ligase family protein [Saprospiraceae bacterium]